MNESVFFLVNGWRGPWIDRAMWAASAAGEAWNGLILLVVLLLAALWRPQLKGFLRVYIPAYAVSSIGSNLLKNVFAMPRPPLALPGKVIIVDTVPATYSFPSGHATFTAMLAVLLWPYLKAWQRVAMLGFVLLVGVSRLSLGAHFPIDVLAGWAFGATIAWAACKILGQTPHRGV